jgi:hypothetical protein
MCQTQLAFSGFGYRVGEVSSVKDGGLGSVDGCGEADTPGMNRSEVSGSYGIVLDFFR